jgi:glutathione S-transferase
MCISGLHQTRTRLLSRWRSWGSPYNIIPINIGKGDQFKSEFLEISPNNKMHSTKVKHCD